MASVSKRVWRTAAGEVRSAWVLSFVDQVGRQQRKHFPTKRDADAERIRVEGALSRGVHVTDGPTVLDAAKAFLQDFEDLVRQGRRERSTLRAYEEHVRLHISSRPVAAIKVSRLTAPDCSAFAKELEGRLSDPMARRVLRSLKSILRHAQGRGWIVVNPAEQVAIRTLVHRIDEKVEIPSKEALARLLGAAQELDENRRAEAFVSLLLFGGLRISELRGLRRCDVDVLANRVSVVQRADRWQQLGAVKSKASRRSVPLPESTMAAIRGWMLRAPLSPYDLLFPNGVGNVEIYQNFYQRLWIPLLAKARLVKLEGDDEQPAFGMHALRHAAVSLWIEQGVNPKKVQRWAGHASIQFTMDVYGHLWDDPEGDSEIAERTAKSVMGGVRHKTG